MRNMAKASAKAPGKAKIRYYIGKKQYAPEISDLLCVTICHPSGFGNSTSKLYRTAKGSFFLVTESPDTETKVQLLDEKAAFDFMDQHTACIDTDTYDKVFGTPEQG